MPARFYHAVRYSGADKEKGMSRKTAILVCVTLAAFYLLLQDMRTPPEHRTHKERFLYHIDPELIREITVIKQGKPYVTGAKIDDENWMLTHPVETEAAGFAFAPVQNFVGLGKYLMVISREGTKDFSFRKYGLEDPPISVMFTAENKRYGFDVSPVRGDKLFVRKHGDDDSVYAVPSHFYNFFNRHVSDYRPSTVFSFNDTNVEQIELAGPVTMLIEKPPRSIWLIRKPFVWPGASDIIADYLKRMKALRITSFVKDSVDQKGLAEYGITGDSPRIRIALRDGSTQVLTVGRKHKIDKTEVYYFTSGNASSVYAAPAVPVDILLKPDIKLFRSRKLAFFDNRQISRITVDHFSKQPTERITLERAQVSDPWKCTEPADERVGTVRINNFIKTFIQTDIMNFTMEGKDKIEVFDLDDPDIVITFFTRDKTGRDRKIYRLSFKDKGGGQIYGYIDADVYGTVTILRIPSGLYTELASGLAAFKTLYILRGARENISWFAVSGVNRVRFECRRTREGGWEVVEPTDKLIEERELHETLLVLSNLKAEHIVTLSAENYAQYGFDNPQASVSFVAFGKKYSLLIGKTVPGTSHSYVRVMGSSIIYALARDKVNQLTKDTGLFIKNKQ